MRGHVVASSFLPSFIPSEFPLHNRKAPELLVRDTHKPPRILTTARSSRAFILILVFCLATLSNCNRIVTVMFKKHQNYSNSIKSLKIRRILDRKGETPYWQGSPHIVKMAMELTQNPPGLVSESVRFRPPAYHCQGFKFFAWTFFSVDFWNCSGFAPILSLQVFFLSGFVGKKMWS